MRSSWVPAVAEAHGSRNDDLCRGDATVRVGFITGHASDPAADLEQSKQVIARS